MKGLKWINTGAFVSMVTVNLLAELLPIGGSSTGQVSEMYPTLFTPAPVAFAIWGLIYLLMLMFILCQYGLLIGRDRGRRLREMIGPWFAVSCGLNMLWIFLWHSRLISLSAVCILLLLVALGVINGRLQGAKPQAQLLQRLTVNAGFSLYYGWIIAAAIANISVYLTARGWDGWGFSQGAWAVVILVTGAAITVAVTMVDGNRIAAAAVMWAYAGILIRHISPTYLNAQHPYVIAAAVCSEAIILAAILFPLLSPACRRQMPDLLRHETDPRKERTHI